MTQKCETEPHISPDICFLFSSWVTLKGVSSYGNSIFSFSASPLIAQKQHCVQEDFHTALSLCIVLVSSVKQDCLIVEVL